MTAVQLTMMCSDAKSLGQTKTDPSYHVRAKNVRGRLKHKFDVFSRLIVEEVLRTEYKAQEKGGYLFLDSVIIKLGDIYSTIHYSCMSIHNEDLFYLLDNTHGFAEICDVLHDFNVRRIEISKKMPLIHVFDNKEFAGAINFVTSNFLVKNKLNGIVDRTSLDKNMIDRVIDRSNDHSDIFVMCVARHYENATKANPTQRFISNAIFDINVLKLIKSYTSIPK